MMLVDEVRHDYEADKPEKEEEPQAETEAQIEELLTRVNNKIR